MTNWEELSSALAEQLATLPAGAIVKIFSPGPSGKFRYVQFAQKSEFLAVQLTGGAHLDQDSQPTLEGRRHLVDLGWQLPDLDHADNWWIELPWPVMSAIYHQLATMVVAGFRDVFRITDPNSLVYDAWNDEAGNESMSLPLLGLTRIDAT